MLSEKQLSRLEWYHRLRGNGVPALECWWKSGRYQGKSEAWVFLDTVKGHWDNMAKQKPFMAYLMEKKK